MRRPAPGDFQVDVDGIGLFTFARRTMRDEFAIAAEYSRLTEGVANPTEMLHLFASAFSVVKVLMVSGPAAWDVETLDPYEDSSYSQLMAVSAAVREAEDRFRSKSRT